MGALNLIWADLIGIAAVVLTPVVLSIAFLVSDAPLREAQYNARAEKLAAACTPRDAAPSRSASAAGDASSTSASDAPTSDTPASDSPASDAVAGDGERSVGRLPSSVCSSQALEDATEAEEEEARAPTLSDLASNIGQAELLFAAPLWVGLRVFDFQTGGPKRRLARNAYWKSTRRSRHDSSRMDRRSSERSP